MLCRYLGEWYDTSTNTTTHEILSPYSNQKSAAMTNCWVVGGVYFALALVCGLGMVYHKLRRNI